MARVMANKTRDTEIRFVTFGAEEYGLYGSKAYVNSLTTSEVGRMVGEFQLDMVGSKNSGTLIMYTVDGSKNVVTDLGATYASQISGVIPYGQLGRSDHVPFYQRGIPSALFVHAPVEPEYHSPQDTIENISKPKLLNVAQIVGESVYKIIDPTTPSFDNYHDFFTPVDYPFENRPPQ